ncbi:MAG: porin family protein [Deltaproteobacteria bacterium]|nr:porin family protein [Deltaproteobacteria bacterium]
MKMYNWSVRFLTAGTIFFLFVWALPGSATAGGWYLRGAIGYEKSRSADMADVDCSSVSPPALFGCAAGDDGLPIGAYGDFGSFPLAEAALGRRLLPWLRVDLALTYRFHMNYDGNANFLSVGSSQPVSAKADSLSGMLNVFVDINGFLPGKKLWRFEPYLGGGAGFAYNRLGEMTFLFPGNPGAHKISITPAGDRTDFAYMLAAGTGIILTDRLSLDVAYRYSDLGRVETSAGNMFMDVIPAGIAVNGIESRLRTHGLTVGLRYQF